MLPGQPQIERADLEEDWDDFFCSQSGNMSHQTVNDSLQQETAFIISTPGMSPSALFEESDHGNDTCCDTPLQRLIRKVNMMSPKALSASVRDIGSTVCMTDGIASSAPLNKSKGAVGEDLVGTIASCLRKRCVSRFGGTIGSRKTKQYRGTRMYNSYRQLMDWENFGLNSKFTCKKRPRIETLPVKHALLEEIRKINQQLIDTVVSICDKDTMTTEAGTVERSEGIIVKCSFVAMAISPKLIAQQASPLECAVHPLKLLVPKSYPRCSPIFKKLHAENLTAKADQTQDIPTARPRNHHPDYEDLSFKAMERFDLSVRRLPHPFSLSEVARTWDLCARAVVSEYAEQNGGGSFSSKYGTWEDCLHAA